MPIEIRELIIRAVVEPRHFAQEKPAEMSEQEREAFLQACVDETLRALRRTRDR